MDDDERIRELMVRLLSTSGYRTMTAENGEQALERMRERRPCVVLLDLQMPVMDGWEFRRRQLEDPALADVPVVCVTGFFDQAELFHGTGIQCLTKPVELSAVLQAVRRACGVKQ